MENKNETLAKLYCIKAGLSAISLQAEGVYKLEADLIDCNKKIEEHNKKISISGLSINSAKTVVGILKQDIKWAGFKKLSDYDIKARKKEIRENNKLIKEYESDIENSKQIIDTIKAKYPQRYLAYCQERSIAIPTAKVLWDSLVEEYFFTLDPRDWCNIDLIIFYYETNRADTLKEALHLVDEQRHHESLINEIKAAADTISRTIMVGINQLRVDINSGFTKLSTQLSAQHNELIRKIDLVNSNLLSINGNIVSVSETLKLSDELNQKILKNVELISSNTYLNNALLQRINTNSMNLVDDANYLLFYEEPKELNKVV